MKYKIIAFISFLFVFTQVYGKESPANAMQDFLSNDYLGKTAGRQGKVIFSVSLESENSDCDCNEPKENFYVTADPINIIFKPGKIQNVVIKNSTATFIILYEILALTKGQGEGIKDKRIIIPLEAPQIIEVKYRLKFKGDKWYIINPTIPYVGIDSIIKTYEEKILFEKQIRDKQKFDSRDYIRLDDLLKEKEKQFNILKMIKMNAAFSPLQLRGFAIDLFRN